MNLRKELDELRRKARLDECPACGTYDIEVVWGPKPGEEREDKPVEPCHVCGKRPIVINWSSLCMTADLSSSPEALSLALCQTHLMYVLNLFRFSSGASLIRPPSALLAGALLAGDRGLAAVHWLSTLSSETVTLRASTISRAESGRRCEDPGQSGRFFSARGVLQ